MTVEVEVRSFVTKEKYEELLSFFRNNAEFVNEDYQETFYFDSKEDLRIQKNNFFSKIWLKKGKMHDESREEIEIKFGKSEFEKLEKLFLSVGFNVQIKWFRTRHTFKWQGVDVMVDFTRGYGYIIEIEKISEEQEKDKTLAMLKEKLEQLGIKQTPKEEFDAKFKHYKEYWQKLVAESPQNL